MSIRRRRIWGLIGIGRRAQQRQAQRTLRHIRPVHSIVNARQRPIGAVRDDGLPLLRHDFVTVDRGILNAKHRLPDATLHGTGQRHDEFQHLQRLIPYNPYGNLEFGALLGQFILQAQARGPIAHHNLDDRAHGSIFDDAHGRQRLGHRGESGAGFGGKQGELAHHPARLPWLHQRPGVRVILQHGRHERVLRQNVASFDPQAIDQAGARVDRHLQFVRLEANQPLLSLQHNGRLVFQFLQLGVKPVHARLQPRREHRSLGPIQRGVGPRTLDLTRRLTAPAEQFRVKEGPSPVKIMQVEFALHQLIDRKRMRVEHQNGRIVLPRGRLPGAQREE